MKNTSGPALPLPADEEGNEAIVRRYDCYLMRRVQFLVYQYATFSRPEVMDLEADELVQRVRIKFWRTLEKNHILYPQAYLKRIIYSEFSDMRRQQKAHLPLPLEEDSPGPLFAYTEGALDPAEVVEQQQTEEERLNEIIRYILALPARQQQAIICLLRDQVDDPVHLSDIFKAHKVNIEELRWPGAPAEKKLLQASLYIARQTLARKLKIDLSVRKRCRAYSGPHNTL